MLELRDFEASYGGERVLRQINLVIRPGEKVALIGPSGAGKTTLLKSLYALQPQASAFIHQHHALVPRLPVFHNIFAGRLDQYSLWYNLRNLVKPHPEEISRIRRILNTLSIEEKIFEKAGSLSGGQMQRVAVARALFRQAPLLLGDEPVSSIDPKQAQQVSKILREAAQTVVLSLHSVQLALETFDRIVGLRGGQILFDLPNDQVSIRQQEELFAPC